MRTALLLFVDSRGHIGGVDVVLLCMITACCTQVGGASPQAMSEDEQVLPQTNISVHLSVACLCVFVCTYTCIPLQLFHLSERLSFTRCDRCHCLQSKL